MKKFHPLLASLTIVTALVSCSGQSTSQNNDNDTVSVDTVKVEAVAELKGDAAINKALRFYAGISSEGINMTKQDSTSWKTYSNTISQYIARSKNTTNMVEQIASNDFADFRDKVDYVFYPFSGADFMYPITLFPDADTYFMCGLEKTGTPIGSEINTKYSHYEAYRQALQTFFRASYFITREMQGDFHNKELDGVCPVMTMLMAVTGHEVISIKYKNLDNEGNFVDTDEKSDILEFKFFRTGTQHEQTIYYVSGNVENKAFDPNLQKYLDKTLPQHKVATYLKAASFLMHYGGFSMMRDYVLNNSLAVIEDDSGIPYHFFTDYDVTLYGKYKRPTNEFPAMCYQPDLEKLYHDNAATIKPLQFRIGYNYPSNWLCARRKATNQQ